MNRIAGLARRLVKEFGTSSPFTLCDGLEIDVFRPELPVPVRGLCFQNEAGGSVILLNSILTERESIYCCAHELGHVLLHPGINAQTIADLTNLRTSRYEREADFFAACLFIDPNLEEWRKSYDSLTTEQISCLSGLPERVVRLRFETPDKI